MIRDHGHDVHRQLADALAIQQVVQAVVRLGHHDQHFGPVMRGDEFGHHVKRMTTFGEARTKSVFIEAVRLAKFDADEKTPGALIVEGMVLGDVALMLKQVACDCIDGAEPAGAIGSENPGIRGAAHAGVLIVVK
ncbi:hypothetical protein Pfra02_19040 [Pseudomonas fragi]|nr:hypothetical protein Pfra02_19040 [Pseudomonas fragi]